MEIYTFDEFSGLTFEDMKFIKTNCKCIDSTLNGLVEGGIHLIAGATGNGKSLLLLHLALNIAKTRQVFYISLENDIRIDNVRFKLAKKQYGITSASFLYMNGIDTSFVIGRNQEVKKNKTLLDLLGDYNDAVVVIDGPEYITSGKDGTEMYNSGNDLVRKLQDLCKSNNLTFLLSWQMQRGSNNVKIEDISTDYLSTSIGAPRVASSVWCIKKDNVKRNWALICLKSRTEIYNDIKAYPLSDEKNKFDIRIDRDNPNMSDNISKLIASVGKAKKIKV